LPVATQRSPSGPTVGPPGAQIAHMLGQPGGSNPVCWWVAVRTPTTQPWYLPQSPNSPP
jgi:hypothetical protein